MNNLKALLIAAAITLMFSCEQRNKGVTFKDVETSSAKAPPEAGGSTYAIADANQAGAISIINGFISSSAAVENGKDTTHKFIRTADMKCRVKNVLNSTLTVEDITQHFNGFVINTNLTSTINSTNTTPVSTDSSLESTYYTVENSITLRVPNIKLDSTLRSIAAIIDYLDYRRITAEDVAPQLLSDQLKQKRISKYKKRLGKDIDNNNKQLNYSDDAEQSLVNREEEADNALLHSLTLMDKVKFSTINVIIYQRPEVKRVLLANDKNIAAYQPSFGSQLLDAVKTGWDVLENILLALIKTWPLLLIILAVLLTYLRLRKR